MKSIFICLVFIVIKLNILNAQIVFAPQTAKWYYEGQGQINSYNEIEHNNDTVILGITAHVLLKKQHTWLENQNREQIDIIGKEIVYTNDSVVYLYTNNKFDTLYVFNATKGLSWNLYCYPQSGICTANAKITVRDTGSISINSHRMKYYIAEYSYPPFAKNQTELVITDTIIERREN